MYKIKVISNFSAAHFLRDYKGKCENLHGHNWKVEVVISSAQLDSLGMVMDFGKFKEIVKDILEGLDHKCLNDLDSFGEGQNPSSEIIAKYIYAKVKEKILDKGCGLEEVRVWETDNSCAIYW